MMERQSSIKPILTIGIPIVLLLIFAGYFGLQAASAAVDQPIAYSHRTHVEAGAQCLFCHSQATRSQIAGIPSVQKCMGCHSVIQPEGDKEIRTVIAYWEQGRPIPWNRVNKQPEFVYFSHRAHVNAGYSCESCHGDVGSMDGSPRMEKSDMGWCLACHNQGDPENIPHLIDCIACHK